MSSTKNPVLTLSNWEIATVWPNWSAILLWTMPQLVEKTLISPKTDWPSSREMSAAISDIWYKAYMNQIQLMNLSEESQGRYNYMASFIHISTVLLQNLNFSRYPGSQLSTLATSLQKYFSDKPTELRSFHEAITLCVRSVIFHTYVDRSIAKSSKVVDRSTAQKTITHPSWEEIINRFNLIDGKFCSENIDYSYYLWLLWAAYTLMDKWNPDFIALPNDLDLES